MYKRSEPIRLLQSVKNHMANAKFVYKQKNFPKFQSFFFFKNTPKYDKLSKISNISIKTMLELRTKFGNFGNFGNFGHISDGLRKQSSVRTQCCNLIGSEPLYIPCSVFCWQSQHLVLLHHLTLRQIKLVHGSLTHLILQIKYPIHKRVMCIA